MAALPFGLGVSQFILTHDIFVRPVLHADQVSKLA